MEQEALLQGTDRYNLYGVRAGRGVEPVAGRSGSSRVARQYEWTELQQHLRAAAAGLHDAERARGS